jgi:hypothetical protein
LKVLHCGNATCSAGNSVTSPDSADNVGTYTSLALDSSGFPVIAYHDLTNGDLKVMHCNDVNCAGGGEAVTSPDTAGTIGTFTSLALDTGGRPVVSYHDETNGDLRVLHCSDVNCTAKQAPNTATATPTGTPTRTPTATPTRTPTPTSIGGSGVDSDFDGCTDEAESQPAEMVGSGGGRDQHNFWDFFDVPTGAGPSRDKSVAAPDVFAVIFRFNSEGDSGISPLSPPPAAPAYHPAYDRGPSAGPNTWNLTAANGTIAATDVFAVIGQFGHACA